MGCFTSETEWELPGHLSKPINMASQEIMKLFDKSYTPYTGQMVAGMTPTQTGAMKGIDDMLKAPGISAPRLIDDVPGMSGGPAGSTADYMNPHLKEVMEPILRNIRESTKQNLMDVDAGAHMAGAFGDAGHGVEKAETRERGVQAAGDATSRAYSDAFASAMGMKAADIDRLLKTKVDNRNTQLELLLKKFGMGGVEQQTNQAQLTAKFEEFMRKQGFDANKIKEIVGLINDVPSGTRTTQPSTMSSLLSGASSIASMLFGMPGFGSGGTIPTSPKGGSYV